MLENSETELDLLSYYQWLDEENQWLHEDKTVERPKLSKHACSLIVGVLDSVNKKIVNKIDSIVKIIKGKVWYIYCIQRWKHCLFSCHYVYWLIYLVLLKLVKIHLLTELVKLKDVNIISILCVRY